MLLRPTSGLNPMIYFMQRRVENVLELLKISSYDLNLECANCLELGRVQHCFFFLRLESVVEEKKNFSNLHHYTYLCPGEIDSVAVILAVPVNWLNSADKSMVNDGTLQFYKYTKIFTPMVWLPGNHLYKNEYFQWYEQGFQHLKINNRDVFLLLSNPNEQETSFS